VLEPGPRSLARRRRRRRLGLVLALVVILGLAGYVAFARRADAARVHTGDAGAHGATIVRWRLHSRFVHQTPPVTAAEPPGGGAGRPLLVFLHGRGRNGNESNANDAFFAALAAQGARAPDVVFPNGGDHSYWHARGSGRWDRYVLDGRDLDERGPTAPGAFDGAADETFAAALQLGMRQWAGGHDAGYWSAHYRAYLRFYAGALARC
jgi:hypothetical protein